MTDISSPSSSSDKSVLSYHSDSLVLNRNIVENIAHTTQEMQPNYSGYPTIFVKTLQNFIANRDAKKNAALIMVSLNNLPMMISGYGHQSTEEAISALLFSLKSFMHSYDNVTLHRIQKDQLAIICEERTLGGEYNGFDQLARAISLHIKQFGHASRYGVMHILVSTTYIALPEKRIDANDLLNEAYIALENNLASSHSEHELFIADPVQSRLEMNMVSYITDAIRDEQLKLAYQPIVSSKTGEISHYEALLRVVKENGELTTAGPLIPVAERMGLIDMIDELVLEMVVQELLAYPELHLAFNVSNLTTNSAIWLHKLQKIARDYPDVVSRMMVEITETAVHLDLRRTAYFVAAVQSYGAQVALDDFGSGYTSFRQLKSLSVDIIKIDGVFVKDLVNNHDNRLFIKTMLDFTNGFGLQTVAEFVENGETAKMLMDLGVEYMQGYYFGFPEIIRK